MTEETEIRYRRARFSTRLPTDRLYTASHYWLRESDSGLWEIGFTRFATRMLGEFVEIGFDVEPGGPIAVGNAIGWVEGFKAVSDVYSVVTGQFARMNPALREDITLAETDGYGRGWLYSARGVPDPRHMTAGEYVALLDGTIDKMLEQDADRYA